MYYLVECLQLYGVGTIILPILLMRKVNLSDKAIQRVSSRVSVQTQEESDSKNLSLTLYTSASQNVLDTVGMKGRENLDSSIL